MNGNGAGRMATARDLPEVLELVREVSDSPITQELVRTAVETPDGARCVFVAEAGGEVVATVMVRHGELSCVATRPDKRRQGYATAVLRAAVERAQRHGYTPWLGAYRNNLAALALYWKMGFEVYEQTAFAVWLRLEKK